MAPIDKLDVANVITQTIAALSQRAVPPTKLAVNEVEAASILGVDIHALRSDRREAKRDGRLKF